ncbi:MAG: carbohydrate kinase family protein [Chloroflexi bacterium]|nr:MAG: carbohydrate kinase family protein [Chloroflexota bacterium]
MNILVSGLINIETTLQVDRFPVEYFPVRYPFFGVHTTVSGVGFNIARALSVLGDQARFITIIGSDPAGVLVKESLQANGIDQRYVINSAQETAQSVILFDSHGKRQIHVDLKDIQEISYPQDLFDQASKECALAVLSNINFSRPFLQTSRLAGIPVATDIHAISSLDDDYNRDFMASANILFMSDELLPCSPEEWARHVVNRYGTEILVIGLGAQGALLSVKLDGYIGTFPAQYTRPVINTIGAGDALFSCFVHDYARTKDPYTALKRAITFASWKIGEKGAAEGFLSDKELDRVLESQE